MDFNEFSDKILQRVRNFDDDTFSEYYTLFKKCSNFYHVVIHKLAYESFIAKLSKNIIVLFCPLDAIYDHVHICVWSKEQFQSSQGIQSEPIKNEQHREFIQYELMNEFYYYLHDYYCSVTFEFVSLQFLSQKIILKNLSCLQGINQLTLPKKLKNNLFQQGKSCYEFPEWDKKTLNENIHVCEIDHVYDKQVVISNQNTKFIHRDPVFIVKNYFVYERYKVYTICQNCIHFELEKEDFRRDYVLCFYEHAHNITSFVTDTENWCLACKQVPLFQILNETQVYKQYKFDKFDIIFKGHNHVLIKQDIFENGVFVNTHARSDIIF